MKQYIILTIFLVQTLAATSQKSKEKITFYDASWNVVKKAKSSAYFKHMYPLNDSCWRLNTYNISGPMLSSETVSDASAVSRNGRYSSYQATGYLDSTGVYRNNLPHGDWFYCNMAGEFEVRKTFDNGVLINTDTAFPGNDFNVMASSLGVIPVKGKQPGFDGGSRGWLQYISKNLRMPSSVNTIGGSGQVGVIFLVEENGKVNELLLIKSTEVMLDQEAIRLIADAEKWIPVTDDNKKVKAYGRQLITFRIDR